MKRHEVSDNEWAILEPVLPKSKAKTGRPPRNLRQMLNGLMWVLSTGAPWRDLPERFGPWETVYGYFRKWRGTGVFDAILNALHLHLDREGKIDWDLWCIDGTSIRATRAAAGASKKLGRQTLLEELLLKFTKIDIRILSEAMSLSTSFATVLKLLPECRPRRTIDLCEIPRRVAS